MKIRIYIQLLRPIQWLKNLMLYFPPFLGGQLLQTGQLVRGALPLLSYCLGSSACYIVNDVMDRGSDAIHPRKKDRPLASGQASPEGALLLAVLLLVASVKIALQVSATFFQLLMAYLVISLCYTMKLKELPVIDLFCIAAGFVLRLEAGGEAFDLVISEWLFLSVFLLAVFLATGKRLGEQTDLGAKAGGHRKSLLAYPDGFLQGTLCLTGAAVLVTYTQYVIFRHTLVYTVPLCCFGLLRFIFRVLAGKGGDPTESLLRDLPLFLVGALWVLMVGWSLYEPILRALNR